MKIKKDFITNSSSTSFIGWGITIADKQLLKNKDLLENAFENYKEEENRPLLSFSEFKKLEMYEIKSAIRYFIEKQSSILEASSGSDGDWDLMIAAHPEGIRDNQTLSEYKDQIISDFSKLGIDVDKKDLNFISESWMDG